jgi:hypothetical protein
VVSVLGRFVVMGYPISKISYLQARSTENARYQLKRMVKILREVRQSVTGAYPIVEVESHKMVFYADIDTDSEVELVRYELSGTDLIRGVTKPSGEPPVYDTANEAETVLSRYVRNGSDPVFTYYGGDYPADTTELATAQIKEIRYVSFRLVIDVDEAHDPPPIEVVSQVHLRNLKTNLNES